MRGSPRSSYKVSPDCTLVPEAFFYSLLANFATRTASFIFFLSSVSAESREKKASGRDRWESHFHAISF